MRDIVIYHKSCFDGTGAAWAAKQALSFDAEFLPMTYGDPIPWDKLSGDVKVWVVDFSFSREDMLRIAEAVASLRVLDHHKTAQEACEGLPFCTFDVDRSGAGITWDELNGGPRPVIIDYVEDRDLWKFNLPYSKEVHAWLSSYPHNLDVWDTLASTLENSFNDCVTQGQAILRYHQQKVDELVNLARLEYLAGYKVPIVNCPYQFGSDVGHVLLDKYPDAKFSGYYFIDAKGVKSYGLRGRAADDFDVSEIAKMFGGGGHKKASGFRLEEPTRNTI